ncbi:hypothetical protein SAMN04488137_1623 [Fictibacillus solisalsi]|uniref:Uncharacterized protein n=1 Tax=Fictibacillus solisalsi TaxID=459525 RepID=A0A1G9VJ51_9BACL|nr:hypothetical protein [Fictibacillus solisalsi]SDM72252.1 hypothetical protein SAMN04488137_1623 [Fictibacillus solisalsi]
MDGGTVTGPEDFMIQFGPIIIVSFSALVIAFIIWVLIRLTRKIGKGLLRTFRSVCMLDGLVVY